MGRAATLNGNGRAVLPPSVADAMRRYRQPPPPPRSTARLIGKVFGWIALAVLVVGSGLAGGAYLYGHETLNAIGPHTARVKKAQHDLVAVPPPSQPATALVVGYDQRAGVGGFGAKDSRSDTLMLLRADPQNDTLSIMSFPRDLNVPIYCDTTTARTVDRINAAWTDCGPEGTLDTVQKLTGIPVNYLITLDFHGFKLIVNKLHGVYMNVDHRYYIPPHTGVAAINLEPGYQKLDGQDALNYVRFRETDNDLYRNARQQLFLEALKDRLSTSLSIFKIPQLIGAVKRSLEVAGGGSNGTPTISEIQSYLGLGYHLKPGHLFRVNIDNLYECGLQNAQLCANQSDVNAAVDSFLHPDVTVADRANAAALGIKVKKHRSTTQIKRSQITTLVLNGTNVGGLARDTSYKLAVAGFHTVQLPASVPANTPQPNYTSSFVYYDSVQPDAQQAAQQLKTAMGADTRIAPLPPQLAVFAQQAGNPLAIVAVGTLFGGEIVNPQAHIEATPTHEPPHVRDDPGASLYSVQQVRTKVPFQIMLPHKVESSSRLTSLDPVRVFRPAVHTKELALTFVTGAGNVYWNVIETNWTSAPILRHETGQHRIANRVYHLYTTGGHIHMIVFRKAGVSYWVINTLRDELSNETMVAIAKGLQPLGK